MSAARREERLAPVMRPGRVKVWADGYGRWYAAVPGDLANPRRTAGRAIRREIDAREALPIGYRVRIERAPLEWHTSANPDDRPVFREVMA